MRDDFEEIELNLGELGAGDRTRVLVYLERVRAGLELITRLLPDNASLYVSRALLCFAVQTYVNLVRDGSKRAWLASCAEAWDLELARDKTARRKSSTPAPPNTGDKWSN